MPAHDAQAVVERHVGLAAAGDHAVGREELADQIAHQARALFAVRRLQHGRFEARRVPSAVESAPAAGAIAATLTTALRAFVQLGEERLVAHAQPQCTRVLEQTLGQIEARHGCLGMLLAHELGVLAKHRAFHVARTDHVVRHQQELAARRPAVARHHIGQLGRGAGLRVAGQQQVQHGHEVAFARAETAVQVRRLAAARLHGLLNEAQRVAEGVHQLGRYHVVAQRLVGVGDALRQLEHEVALVHPLRDMNQVLQQRHSRAPCMRSTSWGERVVLTSAQARVDDAGLALDAFLAATGNWDAAGAAPCSVFACFKS